MQKAPSRSGILLEPGILHVDGTDDFFARFSIEQALSK